MVKGRKARRKGRDVSFRRAETRLRAVFFHAVDEYLAGIEVIVQQNHVRREAGGDFAQAFQAQGLRLVPGGGFHQVAEGFPGQAVHVFQAVGVFEGAAGQAFSSLDTVRCLRLFSSSCLQ